MSGYNITFFGAIITSGLLAKYHLMLFSKLINLLIAS